MMMPKVGRLFGMFGLFGMLEGRNEGKGIGRASVNNIQCSSCN